MDWHAAAPSLLAHAERWLTLWGEGFAAMAPAGRPGQVALVLLGVLLLVAGRKLFWLALAALGFLLGWQLALLVVGVAEPGALVAVGGVGGLVGLLVARLARRVGAVVAGLAVGSLLGAKVLPWTVWSGTWLRLLLPLVTGLIGAVLGLRLLELALRLLTAAVGAALLVGAFSLPPSLEVLLFVGLWLLGLVAQRSR